MIIFINEKWIAEQDVTVYQLLRVTDLLISDVSSVIIDYRLMDQPIICMSADFNEYRTNRGFYFSDIESWIPSRVNTNQEDFFNYLRDVLRERTDPYSPKREGLKNYFFENHGAHSTEIIVNCAMKYKS